MIIETQAGGITNARQTGGATRIPGGTFGELLDTKLLPDFYALNKAGLLFSVSASAINPSAFVGAAAGTPIIGLYNAPNSQVDLVLLKVAVGIRTTGTAAAATDLNHWTANQGGVAITGTVTAPTNLYSGSAAGSLARAMVNTANTAALASTLARPSISIGLTAATAITNVGRLVDEINGEIIVPPGGYYAYGLSVALTAAVISASLLWAEVPV